ncbi:MAG: MBL fold metallo-hydrolase [Ferruginibacter sp.]
MFTIQAFTFNPIQENTYLVYNEFKQCIIIDPGCYFDEEKEVIKNFISKNNLVPTMLLNTHCHLDHVFGNKYIAETYGLPLHLHEKEKLVLSYAPTSGLMYNLPFDNYKGEVIFLGEGDKILLGEDEMVVIEAPGHSPGSICFYSPRQHFLIGGDVLFKGGIGRTDLPMGDHQTLLGNIKNKLLVLPGETVVYSGHGPVTTIGEEKISNPFLVN